MRPFTYEAPAQRMVFGRGTIGQVADEVRRLGRVADPLDPEARSDALYGTWDLPHVETHADASPPGAAPHTEAPAGATEPARKRGS